MKDISTYFYHYYAETTDSLTIVVNSSSSLIHVPAPASTLWLHLTVSLPDILNSTKSDEVGKDISQVVKLGTMQ